MDARRFTPSARMIVGLALASALASGAVGPASAAGIIYVRAGYGGASNGTSWFNGYHDLGTALGVAENGDQIWVASGVYRPHPTDRGVSFTLKTGVQIYGGFAGTETLLGQRNPALYPTILSGDIGVRGDASDNSYHVVSGGTSNNTALLDGFTITAGNANGANPNDSGAGMYNPSGSPRLQNLIFSANSASARGGGMYNGGAAACSHVTFRENRSSVAGGGMHNDGGNPSLTDVTFLENWAGVNGGGLFNQTAANPTLTNVTFSANAAGDSGGGMCNDGAGSPLLTHVVFRANWASGAGGGVYNHASGIPALTDVVFNGNNAKYGGGISNDQSSPKFTSATFTYNWAYDGGGMHNFQSHPKLTGVTFNYNWANGAGGAMYNATSNPILNNVTFSKNEASGGGGMLNDGSSPVLTNVTFNGNTSALSGGAMYNVGGSPNVRDAILWGDGTEVFNVGSTPQFFDSVIKGGCPAGIGVNCNFVVNADPRLGPLQNNGGLTKTMALGAGSAAIDAGGVVTTCVSKDQRGVARPQGGKCDIGAYEVKAAKYMSGGTDDGWVLESTESSGVGGSMNSAGTMIFLGDDAANKQYRGLLSFNTSSLPDTATVVLAKVKVRKAAVVGTDPFTTHGALALSLKKPYFGTVVGLEIGDFQAATTVTSAGTIGSVLVGGWYTGLLNSAARAAVNKTGTTQLRLRFTLDDNNDHGADYLSVYSGNATSTYRPVLIVYYNP